MSNPDPVVDGWQLDGAAHQITNGGVIRRIEPRAMQVLLLLAANPGAVVSRAELLDTVWGGAFVGDDAVSAAIIKLRRAFQDSARSPRVIETVHKSGYRLIARVDLGTAVGPQPGSEQIGDRTPSTVKVVTLLRCGFHVESPESISMTPEGWRRSTDAFAGAIDAIIRRHGGESIHESAATIGVFGAPIAQEHHAMHAAQAAIEIRESAAAGAPDGIRFIWQIVLVSGAILSGSASDGRRTVHGAPVQRMASLAVAARPGEILLAPETHELALGLLGVHRCEPRSNAAGAGDFSRLDDDAAWSSPWEARAERGLTALFGRDHEVGRLDDLLSGVTSGHGRVVALSGEPGAGKSRLVHEAVVLASAQGFEVFVAAASPLEARTPFFPVRDLLLGRLHLSARELSNEATLRSHLEHAATSSLPDVAALLAVLRPDRVSDDWSAIDPELRRSRSIAAIIDALVDEEQPTLVVFEDLHWADEATVHLVDVMVSRIARRACVAMITYRPDFIDPWSTKSYYAHLRIEALSSSDSARMISHLVGDDPTLDRWKSSVIGRTGGTPLFIEEVVRSAQSFGSLAGPPGAQKLVDTAGLSHAPPGQVPASVHTLVAERIGMLSDGARELLSLAAVIGRDVPALLLESIIADTLDDRSNDLDELQAAELMFGSRYQRDPGYVFKHALTQEVAYSEIPASLRREHHRRVADALEAGIAEQAHVSPELLARHHSGAEQHGSAVDAWVRAAESATMAGAFSDALDHLEAARSSLAHTTSDRERLELSIELSAASALVQRVGPADQSVERAYRRARALAASSGTTRQQYEAAWGLWFVHLMRGEISVALELGNDLFELAGGLDDEALQLEAHHVQWSGLSLVGEPAAVREHAEIGIRRYRPEDHHRLTFSYGGHDPGVCSRNLDAMALWLLGKPGLARERSAAAISLADDLGHPYTQLESFNSALNIALLDGDVDALHRHADVLHELVRNGALPDVASAYADGFRANALVFDGDLAAGIALMRVVAPIWQEFWGAWCFPLDSALATALATTGDTAEAIDHVEMRLALADESGSHWWDPEFHRVHGELLRAQDATDVGPAEAAMERALDAARRQSARFFELRAATSLASLLADTARPDRALELLTATCDLFAPDDELADLHTARRLRDALS
jgi:DNA-binding winged helix-turn-helix (wHTH) protein/RecA/RadA recombinase